MTDGEPDTVVSARLQEIKLFFLNFIKSETSDSFVNHFDGHFAYLKTLDFYFKVKEYFIIIILMPFMEKVTKRF